MHIPKNYFQDRLALGLISVNVFLATISSLLILFRLRGGNADGFIGQYHANLGLSAFQPGSASTYIAFIAFAVFVLGLHMVISMRMYYKRRDFSIAILWMGTFLLALTLIVSNALSVLQ